MSAGRSWNLKPDQKDQVWVVLSHAIIKCDTPGSFLCQSLCLWSVSVLLWLKCGLLFLSTAVMVPAERSGVHFALFSAAILGSSLTVTAHTHLRILCCFFHSVPILFRNPLTLSNTVVKWIALSLFSVYRVGNTHTKKRKETSQEDLLLKSPNNYPDI